MASKAELAPHHGRLKDNLGERKGQKRYCSTQSSRFSAWQDNEI